MLLEIWFCCDDCQKLVSSSKLTDRVLEYSKAVTFQGLVHLARHDAIREADGRAVLEHWIIDLMQFVSKNHPKYTKLAHYFIAGAKGMFPARLRHDVVWNRFANEVGGPGNNKELDLLNEHRNKEFKGLQGLKSSHKTFYLKMRFRPTSQTAWCLFR